MTKTKNPIYHVTEKGKTVEPIDHFWSYLVSLFEKHNPVMAMGELIEFFQARMQNSLAWVWWENILNWLQRLLSAVSVRA